MYWYRIISHAYMDEHPEIGYRLFEDDANAKEYEAHMQAHWSGGTTNIDGHATQDEILRFIHINHITVDKKTMDNITNEDYYYKRIAL